MWWVRLVLYRKSEGLGLGQRIMLILELTAAEPCRRDVITTTTTNSNNNNNDNDNDSC